MVILLCVFVGFIIIHAVIHVLNFYFFYFPFNFNFVAFVILIAFYFYIYTYFTNILTYFLFLFLIEHFSHFVVCFVSFLFNISIYTVFYIYMLNEFFSMFCLCSFMEFLLMVLVRVNSSCFDLTCGLRCLTDACLRPITSLVVVNEGVSSCPNSSSMALMSMGNGSLLLHRFGPFCCLTRSSGIGFQ